MKRLLATFLGLLLFLAACGEPNKLTSGTVLERWVRPEYTTMQQSGCSMYSTYRSGNNTYRTCVAYSYFPVYHPSQYFVKVRGEHEGETLVETHRVGRDYWNELQRGELWEKGAG